MFRKILGIVVLSYGSFAVADTLWFKNGRFETVVIQKETPSEVTFKQGPGVVTMPQSSIEKVDYDTPEENKKIIEFWERKFFYNEEFVPEELKGLAARFRDLQKARDKAQWIKRKMKTSSHLARVAEVRATRLGREQMALREKLNKIAPVVQKQTTYRNALVREINSLTFQMNRARDDQRTWTALREEWQALHRQLDEVSPATDKNVAEYQALADRVNGTVVELNKAHRKIQNDQQNQPRWQSEVVPYMQSIAAFRVALEKQGTPETRAAHPLFFEEVEKDLEQMVSDLKTETIHYSRSGGVMMVDAVINGEFEATLIFDTGASSTTISRELATRLGIKFDDEKKVFSILADGTLVPTTPVVLDSLKVGTAMRKNVRASVIDQPPGPGADGLLGMTFLKYFTIQFNADKGKIELVHLGAEE